MTRTPPDPDVIPVRPGEEIDAAAVGAYVAGRLPGASGPAAEQVLGLLSWRPARVGLLPDSHGGPIAAGRVANLCVVDPTATWTVDSAKLASKSRNTPYAGRTLTGKVRHTIFKGEPVVVDAEATR